MKYSWIFKFEGQRGKKIKKFDALKKKEKENHINKKIEEEG